jgi:hypothetical protein
MQFYVPSELSALAGYVPKFLSIVGRDRWFKRVNQLDEEQRASLYRWKIVMDYHWLEMALTHQSDVLSKLGRLDPELTDTPSLAALLFAGAVTEVHARLTLKGQRTLEGRLRDALKAETGLAALYLELDQAQRLMAVGHDVEFLDLEGTGQFDLRFSRGTVVGEVECKSISADAGRRIHRKDFYRFMEAISPALGAHASLGRHEVLVVTLSDRLSPNLAEQRELRSSVVEMLKDGAPSDLVRKGFQLERRDFHECLGRPPLDDQRAVYASCRKVFGPNTHMAGGLTGGCLIVMRSKREDDTSKPLLEAMRKAATQFSGAHPSFVAVQFHEIEPADLMLPHLRRNVGIISYAVFGHYGAHHINASYFCGFGAVVAHEGVVSNPGFAIPNPEPRFSISPTDAEPFLLHISDKDYATQIGAPLPAPNISNLSI